MSSRISSSFGKEEQAKRELLAYDLQFLYTRNSLTTAEWFLSVLKERYGKAKLASLLHAWQQLKLYSLVEGMPLTNNASETSITPSAPERESALWKQSIAFSIGSR